MTPCQPSSRHADLPQQLSGVGELEDALTRPSAALVESVRGLPSPVVVLGAGGKMGPTLAVLAKRAAEQAQVPLEVIAVSRFSNPTSKLWLESRGVRTHSADLLSAKEVEQLPNAGSVIYLVGVKFGTRDAPSLTWAANTLVPAAVCQRYPDLPMVALSTGNVYPMVSVSSGGARENHPLTPLGEYANSAVARERIFEYASQRWGNRLVLVRLNYAVELRYGVLLDLATQIERGDSIDLTTGFFNCIWQGDANEMILRMVPYATRPPTVFNLTGLETLSVREIAMRLGQKLGKPVRFVNQESDHALLSHAHALVEKLGSQYLGVERLLDWTADWIRKGGVTLGKPTHFEVRDGQY